MKQEKNLNVRNNVEKEELYSADTYEKMRREGEKSESRIFLPSHIIQKLYLLEETYKQAVKDGRSYYSGIYKQGKEYVGKDTARILLGEVKMFKESLEKGTNKLCWCEKGHEDEAKIEIVNAIYKYYAPLSYYEQNYIENEVHIEDGVLQRIYNFRYRIAFQNEAIPFLNFFANAKTSGAGSGEEKYQIKDFRLIESEEEFEQILKKHSSSEEITEQKDSIRMIFCPKEKDDLYKEKGCWEAYKKLFEKYRKKDNLERAIKMFDVWNDIKETAVYYIYAPEYKYMQEF